MGFDCVMTESIAVHLFALLQVRYAYTLRNAHEAASDCCRGKTVENLQTYKYDQYVFYRKRNSQK